MLINQLAIASSVVAGDHIPVWVTSVGDTRRVNVGDLTSYIQNLLTYPEFVTQNAGPSASGFSVSVNDNSYNTWLLLQPLAGYATGTIVLPALANAVDNQEISVNCTQQITTLTVDGNGATVSGAPTSMGADDFFRLRFNNAANTWFRVG